MQNQRIIINTLGRVEQELKEIKKLLKKSLPAYGSNDWWEKEEEKADEVIKQGKYHRASSVKELIRQLQK